jgi:hypothetical protein
MSYTISNAPSLLCTLCAKYKTFVWATLTGTCCRDCGPAVCSKTQL